MLITGATSGIGCACAYKFASNNYDLVIDTSNITQDEVANIIINEYKKWLTE